MSPARPRKPLEPRPVVEGAARAVRDFAPPPDDSFADGVEAHRALKRMRPDTEGSCELGPYIEPHASPDDAPPDASAPLGGLTRTIRFPGFWHAWFSRQTAPRLATLDELIDEREERRVLKNFFRRLKHALLWAGAAAFGAAHWFSDQIAYFVEKLPALKAFWSLVTGAR